MTHKRFEMIQREWDLLDESAHYEPDYEILRAVLTGMRIEIDGLRGELNALKADVQERMGFAKAAT